MIKKVLILILLNATITTQAMKQLCFSKKNSEPCYVVSQMERIALRAILDQYDDNGSLEGEYMTLLSFSLTTSYDKLCKWVALFNDYYKYKVGVKEEHESLLVSFVISAYEEFLLDNGYYVRDRVKSTKMLAKAYNQLESIVGLVVYKSNISILNELSIPSECNLATSIKQRFKEMHKLKYDPDSKQRRKIVLKLKRADKEVNLGLSQKNNIENSYQQTNQPSRLSLLKRWILRHKFLTTISTVSVIGGIFLLIRK